MTLKQIIKLIEWLIKKGYTLQEIVDCLKYIAFNK